MHCERSEEKEAHKLKLKVVLMDYTNQRIYVWDYFSAPIALMWFLTTAWFFALIVSQYFLVPLDQPVVQPPFGGPWRESVRSKKRD